MSKDAQLPTNDPMRVLEAQSPSGEILIRPCLEAFLYSSAPRVDCFVEFRTALTALFGDFAASLRWYKTSDMSAMKKVPKEPGAMLVGAMSDSNADGGRLLTLEMHAGASATDYALPSALFLSEEFESKKGGLISRTLLRLCYPVDAKTVAGLSKGARKCTSDVKSLAGHVGWSQYWNVTDSSVERAASAKMKGWLLRYPGLGYGDPYALQSFVGKGLLAVGSLTWVDSKAASTAKVKAVLAKPAFKEIIVAGRPGTSSVLLQAADRPLLGDAHRREWPDEYSQLGRGLASIRIPDEWLQHLSVIGFEDDEIMPWYLRFFEKRETTS